MSRSSSTKDIIVITSDDEGSNGSFDSSILEVEMSCLKAKSLKGDNVNLKKHQNEFGKKTTNKTVNSIPKRPNIGIDCKIFPVSGDGHCILHAWEIALKHSNATPLTYKDLLEVLEVEFIKNIDMYKDFFIDSDIIDVKKEIAKYIKDKIYSHQVGDMVINALSNATNVAVYINKKEDNGDIFQLAYLSPNTPNLVANEIYLLKSGEHYEPMIFNLVKTEKNTSKSSNSLTDSFVEIPDEEITEEEITEEEITEEESTEGELTEGEMTEGEMTEEETTDAEMTDTEDSIKTLYLHNDPDLPLFQVGHSEPIDTQSVVETILLKLYKQSEIANTSPNICDKNAVLLIDTTKLAHKKDVLSDQHGHWKHTKTKRYKFYKRGEEISKEDEETLIPDSELIHVNRSIYYHSDSKDFHKVLIEIVNVDVVCLQYYFTAGEHAVVSNRPHGNSKRKNPFIRTKKSVLDTIKKMSTEAPKKIISKIIADAGGIEHVKGPSTIPKNRHQIYNVRYCDKNKYGEIEEVLDISKREKGSDAEFVRKISLIPAMSAFLATKQQIIDVARFCTNPSEFSILGVDPTYNIGNYYVTVTTYRHLSFETKLGVNPVMIGPCLVHTEKLLNSYSDLPIEMIKSDKRIKNLLLFGTDSEVNVYQSLRDHFTNSYHLLCDIHMKDNIKSKLTELSISKENKKIILKDIFGTAVGIIKEEGLVDSLELNEFECCVKGLLDKWKALGENESKFAAYFEKHKLNNIKNCMTAELRAMAGLGFPPKPYTQNANECINSVLKRNETTRKFSLVDVIQHIRSVVREQEEQVKLSLIGNGEWTVVDKYNNFKGQTDRFYQMTVNQRTKLINNFNNADVKSNSKLNDLKLSVTPEESLILYPPFSILEDIFSKASKLVKSDVTPATGAHSGKVFMVTNEEDDNTPLLVSIKGEFLSCQKACIRFHAYRICEHCVAVAEKQMCLKKYLERFKLQNVTKKRKLSDITNVDKAKNAGKKATKSTSKRKGPASKKENTPIMFQKQFDSATILKNPAVTVANAFQPTRVIDSEPSTQFPLSKSQSIGLSKGTSKKENTPIMFQKQFDSAKILKNPAVTVANASQPTRVIDSEPSAQFPLSKSQSSSLKKKTNSKANTASKKNVIILKQATSQTPPNNNAYAADIVVPIGIPLPPMPHMTEPQMNPYYLVKRQGRVSKCHGCSTLFNKLDKELLVLKRCESDWWPRVDRSAMTKTWCQSSRAHYYCVQLLCLIQRRPLLKKGNISVFCDLENIPDFVKQNIENNF